MILTSITRPSWLSVKHLFRHIGQSAPLATAAVSGAALGGIAWSVDTPYAAVLMPMALPMVNTRSRVYAMALGYHMSVAKGLIEVAAGWFGGSVLVGLGACTALAGVSALAWALPWIYKPGRSPHAAAASCCTGFVLALLPPFSSFVAGHPIVAWGSILAGSGFLGIGVALAISYLGAMGAAKSKSDRRARIGCMAVAAVVCVLGAFLPSRNATTPPAFVTGINTYFGPPPASDDEIIDRIVRVGKVVFDNTLDLTQKKVLVFPETTLGASGREFDSAVQSQITEVAAESGSIVVLGRERIEKNGSRINTAEVLMNDGRSRYVVQRHPAMLSMWRPWDKVAHFGIDLSRDTKIDLGPLGKARVIICYEEFIPLIRFIDEARNDFDYNIIIANNWSGNASGLARIQAMHSKGMSNLFKRPYVRAVNYQPILPNE